MRTARRKSSKERPVPSVPPVHILAEKNVNPSITMVSDATLFLAELGTGPRL
jgi:hypothetical protein